MPSPALERETIEVLTGSDAGELLRLAVIGSTRSGPPGRHASADASTETVTDWRAEVDSVHHRPGAGVSVGYRVSYAVADDLLGPYTKPAEEPLMSSNEVAAGPGHGMVVESGEGTWYVHHAWPPEAVGSAVPGRQMWLTPLTWTDEGVPELAEPAQHVQEQP